MKFTLSWLKDYLDTSASADVIADALTALGLEVESVENPAPALRPFTVAEIKETKPHPDADKLKICQVDSGEGMLEIVCGAPNARAGIKVALAKIGTIIPNGEFEIKKSKIRGVESSGMMCSARELNLGEDHAGIIELPADAPLGESIVDVLHLDDPLFDIAITPNRADANGVYGIARDLAAAGIGTLADLPQVGWESKTESAIKVHIEDEASCTQFIGCTIRGVKNGPSPEWLRKKLESVGQKSISALVDITNFFTLALNRPLHVYDLNKLEGNIHVRRATDGETLEALNDKTYTLNPQITVIADEKKALGIAGIIGGTQTGCDEATTDIFLEAAFFTPSRIAAAGRDLQILSDARYRFERGVDPDFVEPGARMAVQLILDLCGGDPSALTVTRAGAPVPTTVVAFEPERINALGGTKFSPEQMMDSLRSLGFGVDAGKVTVPSWRADVTQSADLAEEVLRVRGYANIPSTPLPELPPIASPVLTPMQQRVQLARRTLASRGFMEGYHWSMVSEEHAKHFGGGDAALSLQNPIHADLSHMRPSIVPCLIAAWERNARRGVQGLNLFEVGLTWQGTKPNEQKMVAAALRAGTATPQGVHEAARKVDVYDAKADAMALIESLSGIAAEQLTVKSDGAPSYYHPGRSAAFGLGKNMVAYVGELHPATLAMMDVEGPVVACEVLLESLPFPRAKTKARPALQVSEFQAVDRDFAFILDSNVPAAELVQAMRKAEKKLLKSVNVFDLYEGKNLPEGKKSLAVRITLQAMDKTLSDEEIEGISKQMIAAAEKAGAALR